MMTREKLEQMIAEAKKDVTEKRALVEAVRKDETMIGWSALVDYSKAVSRYGALVDVLTYKDDK